MADVDPKLLQILVCPLTKTKLRYDEESMELISDVSGLAYPIQNGVPVMLVDEARIVNPDQVRLIAPHLLKNE
ncbi:MAG: hypothetical protein HEEMFOPI_00187 [Holosporales bacterium]